MPITPRRIRHVWVLGSAEAEQARLPRNDLIAERVDGDGAFIQDDGPFCEYRRSVADTTEGVVDTTTYRLDVPWFGWLFGPLMHRWLKRRRLASEPHPFWAPPDRITPRQVHLLGLLAAASLSAAFVNTIFSQTANFAADEFGISSRGQSLGGVFVRLGVVFALPLAVMADRVGRRKMIVLAAWLSPLCTALGALAPNFWVLVATQAVGRSMSLALALLVGVVIAEEMPRNSRAYAISILALAGGIGASVAVLSLPLADLGVRGWRLVYVITLVWLLVAVHLMRSLPETQRFEAAHTVDPPVRWRRFALIGGVAVSANLFIAPASFLQNRYLKDIRGFSGLDITLFTVLTATPASIGLIAGGRIADSVGRRKILLICLPLSAAALVLSFSLAGPLMYAGAFFGGVTGGFAYPAFNVYRTELFPTGNRGKVNGMITALSLAGSSIGLVLAGTLIDRGWSYGSTMGLLASGQVTAAIVAYAAYPETAHLELEQLNPEDAAV